ncbi:MAG TPA: hypothetical protein VIL43_10015 [Burkholderiales bacterium]
MRAGARACRGVRAALMRNVWLLTGRERASGEPTTLLFSGVVQNKNYLAQLVFGGAWSERAARMTRWRLARLAVDRSLGHAAAIVEHPAPPGRAAAATIVIPCWVGGEIDFARAEDLRRSSGEVQADLRRIRRRGYAYSIESGIESLRRFYDAMYVPYVDSVHRERAFCTPWAEVGANAARCELLLVREGNRPVAGQVYMYEDGGVRAWLLGVESGDREHVRAGAIGAIHVFEIEYLRSKGYARLHVGASRPFLADGALRYKAKRGMRLADATERCFVFRLVRPCRGMAAFLARSPFVYRNGGDLYGAFFAADERSDCAAQIDALGVDGLRGVTVFRPVPAAREGSGWQVAEVRTAPAQDEVGDMRTDQTAAAVQDPTSILVPSAPAFGTIARALPTGRASR